MEEMLTTWKQPVPGSIDTRPVFPIEVTKPIETALIKARTLALQAQQEYARSSQQSMMRGRPGASAPPFRDTPTPPMAGRQPQFPGHAYNIAQDRSYPTPTEQEFRAPSQTPQQYASQQVCHHSVIL
jgi:pre-mRNA cleavage complex 2 protein Pcf11